MPTDPFSPRPTRSRGRSRLIGTLLLALTLVAVVAFALGRSSDHEGAAPVVSRPSKSLSPSTSNPAIETVAPKGSVLDILGSVEGASRFAKVVHSLPKQAFLQERGITLLVPPDSALTDSDVADLVKDQNAASEFVSHYLIVGGQPLKELAGDTTADGKERTVDATKATIDGIKVTKVDVKATNGYIELLAHELD